MLMNSLPRAYESNSDVPLAETADHTIENHSPRRRLQQAYLVQTMNSTRLAPTLLYNKSIRYPGGHE